MWWLLIPGLLAGAQLIHEAKEYKETPPADPTPICERNPMACGIGGLLVLTALIYTIKK